MVDMCPCCTCEEETTIHLFSCTDVNLKDIIDKGITELETAVLQRYLPARVWRAMKRGIHSVREGNDPDEWTPTCQDTAMAYKAQTEIGW